MQLGQLPQNRRVEIAKPFKQRGQRCVDAIRALVKNDGMIEALELLQQRLLRLLFAREKAEIRKRDRLKSGLNCSHLD